MARINDLIDRVENPELRAQLAEEVARMNRQKKIRTSVRRAQAGIYCDE